jgi:hypothetical protein
VRDVDVLDSAERADVHEPPKRLDADGRTSETIEILGPPAFPLAEREAVATAG